MRHQTMPCHASHALDWVREASQCIYAFGENICIVVLPRALTPNDIQESFCFFRTVSHGTYFFFHHCSAMHDTHFYLQKSDRAHERIYRKRAVSGIHLDMSNDKTPARHTKPCCTMPMILLPSLSGVSRRERVHFRACGGTRFVKPSESSDIHPSALLFLKIGSSSA